MEVNGGQQSLMVADGVWLFLLVVIGLSWPLWSVVVVVTVFSVIVVIVVFGGDWWTMESDGWRWW